MAQIQDGKMLASETSHYSDHPTDAITHTQDDKVLASETTYSSEDEVIEQSSSQIAMNGQKLDFEHDGFPWRDIKIRRIDGSIAYFADISV
jgi:hypothetical protein